MSVLIRGMEMPKACVYRENGHLITCPLYDIDGYCGALRSEASHKEDDVLSNCPLVPVPPHGRLIDADALRQSMYHEAFETDSPMQKWDSGCWIRYKMFERLEEKAPTIIPASEEGE